MDKIKEIFKMALHPSQWKELFTRYREIIMYVIFGALTTLVSIVTYFIIRCIFPSEESVPLSLKWTYRLNFSGGDFNGIAQHHIVDSVGDICVYHEQDMGISKQGKGLCKEHPSGSVILCGKAVHAVC